MQNQDPQTPDEKRKDTSAPGREEEVIVNTEEQQQVTNSQDAEESETNPGTTEKVVMPDEDREGERTFKEGLADNNVTEE